MSAAFSAPGSAVGSATDSSRSACAGRADGAPASATATGVVFMVRSSATSSIMGRLHLPHLTLKRPGLGDLTTNLRWHEGQTTLMRPLLRKSPHGRLLVDANTMTSRTSGGASTGYN